MRRLMSDECIFRRLNYGGFSLIIRCIANRGFSMIGRSTPKTSKSSQVRCLRVDGSRLKSGISELTHEFHAFVLVEFSNVVKDINRVPKGTVIQQLSIIIILI